VFSFVSTHFIVHICLFSLQVVHQIPIHVRFCFF